MNLTHGGNIFAIARLHDWRWEDIADFSASINPLGPSPAVEPAILKAMSRIVHYPETEPSGLHESLARRWEIAPQCVMLGNGATELIYFLARVLRPQKVSLAAPVFSEFHRAFRDAHVVGWDPADWPASGLLVVTRPANPTGRIPDLDAYLRATTNPVLVDESFIEFTGQPSILPRTQTRDNLFVLRSLTKFYALPGLRIGALVAPADTVAEWRTHREPWQVSVLAEAAAVAAIADEEHCTRTIDYISEERGWLESQLAALPNVRPQPSCANYFLIALDQPVAPLAAHLLERKIIVRDCSNWPGVPFEHAIRVAVRTRVENTRLIEAWKGFQCA
jgi:threonine-phosphate decarboxylase